MKGIIQFVEKPGCRGNIKQQQLLRDAGYVLQITDILSKQWDMESLYRCFKGRRVHDCVNLMAPILKEEDIEIDNLTESELMDLMIKHPILIRRPIIFHRGEVSVGFNTPLVSKLLGEDQPEHFCQKKVR